MTGGVGAEPLRKTPYTRTRGFGPVFVSAAMGGSALGPAITVVDRFARSLMTSARSTTSAGLAGSFLPVLAASIIRCHSCARAANSESQARSSGRSSRPSGVTSRPPLKAKPAQGPVSCRSRMLPPMQWGQGRLSHQVRQPCQQSEHNIHYAKLSIGRLRVVFRSGLDVLTQLLLKGPVLFGCLALLHLEILHLLAGSINIAERSIFDRSDVLGPVLPLRFRRL